MHQERERYCNRDLLAKLRSRLLAGVISTGRICRWEGEWFWNNFRKMRSVPYQLTDCLFFLCNWIFFVKPYSRSVQPCPGNSCLCNSTRSREKDENSLFLKQFAIKIWSGRRRREGWCFDYPNILTLLSWSPEGIKISWVKLLLLFDFYGLKFHFFLYHWAFGVFFSLPVKVVISFSKAHFIAIYAVSFKRVKKVLTPFWMRVTTAFHLLSGFHHQ